VRGIGVTNMASVNGREELDGDHFSPYRPDGKLVRGLTCDIAAVQ
jgi:hypothetical protein